MIVSKVPYITVSCLDITNVSGHVLGSRISFVAAAGNIYG